MISPTALAKHDGDPRLRGFISAESRFYLIDGESSDRLKKYWAERFDTLSDVLAEP